MAGPLAWRNSAHRFGTGTSPLDAKIFHFGFRPNNVRRQFFGKKPHFDSNPCRQHDAHMDMNGSVGA